MQATRPEHDDVAEDEVLRDDPPAVEVRRHDVGPLLHWRHAPRLAREELEHGDGEAGEGPLEEDGRGDHALLLEAHLGGEYGGAGCQCGGVVWE